MLPLLFEHVPNKEKQPRMMTDQRPIDRWMNCWVGTDDDRRHTADDDYQEAAFGAGDAGIPGGPPARSCRRGSPTRPRSFSTRSAARPEKRAALLEADEKDCTVSPGGATGRRVSAVRRRQRAGLGTPERRPRKDRAGTSRKTLRLLGLNMLEPADDLDLEPAEADA